MGIDPYRPMKIVGQWPGRGTGDIEYRTEDGRIWVPASYSQSSPPLTGTVFAEAKDGQVKPVKE